MSMVSLHICTACLSQLEHCEISHTASDKPFVNLHHLDRQSRAAMSAAIAKLKVLSCITTAICIHNLCSSATPTSWPIGGFQRTHIPAGSRLPLICEHQHDIALMLWQLQCLDFMHLVLTKSQRGLHTIQHDSSMLLTMHTCCCSPNA